MKLVSCDIVTLSSVCTGLGIDDESMTRSVGYGTWVDCMRIEARAQNSNG